MKTQSDQNAPPPWCLTAALTLSVNAAALFGGKEKAQPEEGAPAAQALEIRTYRGIPYQAQFLAADKEGEDADLRRGGGAPERAPSQIDGASFTYTPEEGVTGGDSFTYTATDSAGHVSAARHRERHH